MPLYPPPHEQDNDLSHSTKNSSWDDEKQSLEFKRNCKAYAVFDIVMGVGIFIIGMSYACYTWVNNDSAGGESQNIEKYSRPKTAAPGSGGAAALPHGTLPTSTTTTATTVRPTTTTTVPTVTPEPVVPLDPASDQHQQQLQLGVYLEFVVRAVPGVFLASFLVSITIGFFVFCAYKY